MRVWGLKPAGSGSGRSLRAQVGTYYRCLLLCHLLNSSCYTSAGDLHTIQNLLVRSAWCLLTALRHTAACQCCETPHVQRAEKKCRAFLAKKSHLRQRVPMLPALQLARPKPYLTGKPRAEKWNFEFCVAVSVFSSEHTSRTNNIHPAQQPDQSPGIRHW